MPSKLCLWPVTESGLETRGTSLPRSAESKLSVIVITKVKVMPLGGWCHKPGPLQDATHWVVSVCLPLAECRPGWETKTGGAPQGNPGSLAGPEQPWLLPHRLQALLTKAPSAFPGLPNLCHPLHPGAQDSWSHRIHEWISGCSYWTWCEN